MAQEFNATEAEQKLRPLADFLDSVLTDSTQPEAFLPFDQIAKLLGVSARFTPDVLDFGPKAVDSGPAINPIELFQSLNRTIYFARETHLGGVPTLVPENSIGLGREAPRYTIIDVFDHNAIERVAFDARLPLGPSPDPAVVGNQQLADWLKRVVYQHPWARLSQEDAVIPGLGMSISMFAARGVHARASGQSTTLSYTVNSQNSGLVLDVFPELQYAPRRFGSTVSTPVIASLGNGWWKFETIIKGALVRDRGRHLASSTSTSTITGDF